MAIKTIHMAMDAEQTGVHKGVVFVTTSVAMSTIRGTKTDTTTLTTRNAMADAARHALLSADPGVPTAKQMHLNPRVMARMVPRFLGRLLVAITTKESLQKLAPAPVKIDMTAQTTTKIKMPILILTQTSTSRGVAIPLAQGEKPEIAMVPARVMTTATPTGIRAIMMTRMVITSVE